MGTVNFRWELWSPFFRQLSGNYNIRRRQHFSVLDKYPQYDLPANRNFYKQPWVIDGGRELFHRLANREKNVVSLLEFGWRIDNNRLLPPETFQEFMEGFYAGIYERYTSYGVSYDSLPMPAFHFVRREKTGDLESDHLFVRIGIDDVPNFIDWEPVVLNEKGSYVLPLALLARVVPNNLMPLNPAFFDHDIAHIVDSLNHPNYCRATQDVISRGYGDGRSLHMAEDPGAGNAFTMFGRMCCLYETLCLPDISRSSSIEYLLSTTEDIPDYRQRGSLLVKCLPKFVLRHGGGMVDSYNLHNDLFIRSTPSQRVSVYKEHTTARIFNNTGRELFSQLAVESMLGIASDVEFLCSRHCDLREERLLVQKIGQLETALRVGLDLGITLDKFAAETTQQFIDPESDSYRWLASFTPRHSLMAEYYLSQDTIGYRM